MAQIEEPNRPRFKPSVSHSAAWWPNHKPCLTLSVLIWKIKLQAPFSKNYCKVKWQHFCGSTGILRWNHKKLPTRSLYISMCMWGVRWRSTFFSRSAGCAGWGLRYGKVSDVCVLSTENLPWKRRGYFLTGSQTYTPPGTASPGPPSKEEIKGMAAVLDLGFLPRETWQRLPCSKPSSSWLLVSGTDSHPPPNCHGDQSVCYLINVISDYICTLGVLQPRVAI